MKRSLQSPAVCDPGADSVGRSGRVAACWAVVGLIVGLAAVAAAAGTEEGNPAAPLPAAETLRFRRVFATADRLKDWPRDAARYVPMPRDEFETLVERAARPSDRWPAEAARIPVAAKYAARLLGTSLVDGEAVFEMAPVSVPSTIWLHPCNLAIHEAAWQGPPVQSAELATDQDGKIGVRASAGGRLQVKWSLRARPEADRSPFPVPSLLAGPERTGPDGIEFLLDLPACPANRLTIVAPRRLAPQVNGAVAFCAGSASEATDRWEIELGGRTRCRLRFAPRDDLAPAFPRSTLRESVSYEVSLRGLEVSAQWTLDVPPTGLRQIAVDLDPPLQLVSARFGGQPAPWTIIGSDERGTRAVLELPDSFQGPRRVLRLGAVAPLALDQRWRLPMIRARDTFWQEATAAVLVSSPIALQDLSVRGGRQVQTAPLPSPQSGEMAEFRLFSPDAAIEVVLVQADSPPEFDCGTALELSAVDVAAEVTGRFRLAQGRRFQIEADVSSRWTVDSVETVPASALEDWSVVRGGAESTANGAPKASAARDLDREKPGDSVERKSKLLIRLAKPLSAQRPLKVIVQARHHYSPLGRLLKREDIVPIQFEGASGGRRLVSLRAAEGYRLRWASPEQLTRIEPAVLSAGDLDLFDARPDEFVVLDDHRAGSMAVALAPQSPSYSAAIHVEAEATDAGLHESYAIRCVPEGTKVDRLLVHFSQRRDIPLRWSFSPEEGDPPSVRAWEAASSATGPAAVQGESFEIAFRRPRRNPFEIRASRVLPFETPVSVALAAAPEAVRQEGTVSVRAAASVAVNVAARRLTPVLPESIPSDRYNTLRSVYRYDPVRDVAPASETALILAADRSRSPPPWAWAWSCQVESRFESGGASYHMVTYRIENSGRQRILAGLPDGMETDAVRGVWVDGERVSRETVGEHPTWLSIALPAGRKFPVVSLLLSEKGSSLGWKKTVSPLLPELDVPVLQTCWTVWIPPGYEPAEPKNDDASGWSGSRGIVQRLFGLLGRPEQVGRFRPWSLEDWSRPQTPWSAAVAALRLAETVLDRLGAPSPVTAAGANGESASRPDSDWGSRLGRAAIPGRTLLIDQHALARAGLSAQTPVPFVAAETAADRAETMLQRAGLCLLLTEDAVVVTAASELPRYRGSVASVGINGAWRVLPSPLAERIGLAVQRGGDSTFMPWETWRRLPAPPRSPWTATLPTLHAPTEVVSWSAYCVDCSTDRGADLAIVHGEKILALSWSLFVGVLGLLLWTSRPGRRLPAFEPSDEAAEQQETRDESHAKEPRAFSARTMSPRRKMVIAGCLAGFTAAAVALAPEPFAPIAASVFWALVFWAAWQWLWPSFPASSANGDETPKPRQALFSEAVQLGMAGLIPAVVLASGAVVAQPPRLASDSFVHQVLIPVDDKQQPTGEKYYVPEPLFHQLQAAAANQSDDRRAWTLSSAVYRGTLSWQSATEQFAVEELRASFDLHVFGRQIRVRMPIGRTGVELLPGGIALEGRSIQPAWPDAEGNLSFDVAEPGRYRLDLAVKAAARSSGGVSLVDWRIPRCAASRFELFVPPDAPNVDFPSAHGEVVREPDPSRFVVALGAADRLQIAWPESGPRSAARYAVDVERLLWLKVRPDAVALDVLLNFRVLEGRMSEVELAVDPRLRYFPPPNGSSPVAQAIADPDRGERLRLKLARPVTDKLLLPATFLLEESSGVGRYRLPDLEVLNARASRSLLALSVDPSLEHELSGGENLVAISASAFASAWGNVEAQPSAAWEISSPRADWSVATRPVAPRIAAQQVLSVAVAAQSVTVLLDAELMISGHPVFQHRVAAPPNLEIESVSVREGNVERVARWTRAADGSLVVFLNGPARAKQTFAMRGRLQAPEQGRVALPIVRLLAETPDPKTPNGNRRLSAAETAKRPDRATKSAPAMDIYLYRDRAARVEAIDPSGMTPIESPPDKTARSDLRLVQAFRVDAFERAAAVLAIAPNRPTIQAEQVTRLRKTAEGWQAEVELRGKVRDGFADQVTLDVSTQWSGPFAAQPPASVETVETPEKRGRQVVIRPRTALENDFHLKISSPLRSSADEPPSLPKIVPDGIPRGRRWVILPRVQGGTWHTRGLVPAEMPRWLDDTSSSMNAAAYHAISDNYEATLRLEEAGNVCPEVRLASFRVAWQPSGSSWGLASYTLDPGGLDSCPIVLPPRCRLVQVLVGGQPALVSAESPEQASESADSANTPTRWLVPLASTTLPQRVELLWTGETEEPVGSKSTTFAVPTLAEIPVRKCIFVVAAPATCRVRAGDEATRQTALHHAAEELRELAASLERAAEMEGRDRESFSRWHRDWAQQWLAARSRLERLEARAEDTPETASLLAEIQSLDKQQAAISDRLGRSPELAQMLAESETRRNWAALWSRVESRRGPSVEWAAASNASSISVSIESVAKSSYLSRLVAALGFAAGGMAFAWGYRRGTIPKYVARYRLEFAAAISVAWWWWLSPSALGLAVAVACIVSAVWLRWRQRALAAHGTSLRD